MNKQNLNFNIMIQANELRIGNFVTAVLTNEIYKIDIWALRCIDDGNYQNSNYPKIKVFQPIPLTEEWLLKLPKKNNIPFVD